MILIGLSLLPAASDTGVTSGRRFPRFDGRRPLVRLIDALLLSLAGLFLILPLGQVVVSGLQADLARLISQSTFQQAALTSLLVALVSGVTATLLAFGAVAARTEIDTQRNRNVGNRLMSIALASLSSLVLLVPTSVLATGWFLALRSSGEIANFAPLVVAGINALMALPFAVRVLEPAYREHRARTGRLAESLGLSVAQRLRRVDWPELKRPFLTALAFSMALSLGDLGAVALFGSENIMTLPALIYASMGSYRSTDADGLALLLGMVCLLLALLGAPGTRQASEREAPDAR